MATGIPFPEANTILRAPTPEDAAAGTVYDLHVHRYTDLDGQPNVISKWQFASDELAKIVAAGGVFWFHCWGHTHPPVGISGDNPFVRAAVAGESEKAAEPVSEAGQWRDIATAPKNGTVIDVWRDGSRETVYWGFPPHECGEMGWYCDSDWHSIKKPGWICSTFGEFVGGKHDPFTHWMPLPAGPSV